MSDDAADNDDKPGGEPKDQAPTSERERLQAELYAGFRRLLDSGVEIDELREALQKSFMLTASPEQRRGYDALRIEVDAYLRSLRDGEAAVEVPEGFVPSPPLPGEEDDSDG